MADMSVDNDAVSIRPYQLLCVVCLAGRKNGNGVEQSRIQEILALVRRQPRVPLLLRCNVGSVYSFQNPGRRDDTPEGELFNIKRDLDVLQKLGLVPGSAKPADELFLLLIENIPTVEGICCYGATGESGTWNGCSNARSGDFERGRKKGVASVLPLRSDSEKLEHKRASVAAMYGADRLLIRPHHLMCMTCFHAGRKHLAPIEEDNLFEAVDIIQKNPDIPVTLVAGCCQICSPCSHYDPDTNLCVTKVGAGLRDEKKDLDVLQLLDLKYEDTLPARSLYRLLFDRIPSTRLICGYDDGVARGPEWTICDDPQGSRRYTAGRDVKLGIREL